MSEFEPDGQPVTRRSKIIAVVILGVGVVMMAIALSFPWLDSLDQRWTRCEVIEAVPFQGDNTSSQPWKVQLRTTDCQDIIYSHGVTEGNVQADRKLHRPRSLRDQAQLGIAAVG